MREEARQSCQRSKRLSFPSLSHFDMPAALGGAFGDLTGKESQGMHNPRAFARLFKGHVAKLTRIVFF
jgi:hypothetical protein